MTLLPSPSGTHVFLLPFPPSVPSLCIMDFWRVSPADRERFSIGLVHRVTEECKRRSRGSYE